MDRRSFLGSVFGVVLAPFMPKPNFEQEVKLLGGFGAPVFDLAMLSLPIVHKNFTFAIRRLASSRPATTGK